MGTLLGTVMTKRGGLRGRTISLLRVSECTRVLDRVRSDTCGSLARLPFPFCEPLCFVDGLREPFGNGFPIFPSGVLDARVFLHPPLTGIGWCLVFASRWRALLP